MIHALESWGFRAWNYKSPKEFGRDYELSLVRIYDAFDWESADYLQLWPSVLDDVIHDSGRDESGRMMLYRRSLREQRALDFARGEIEAILIPERVKRLLEKDSLKHVVFKPTIAVKGTGLAKECQAPLAWTEVGTPPWWELSSDLVLPPLSPSMDLRDDKGNPIAPGDCSKGCVPKEGHFNHAELHYRQRDLAAVEPFDVALTFETFGPRGPTKRPSLIASQHFYRVCVDHGLSTNWIPVRVDRDA